MNNPKASEHDLAAFLRSLPKDAPAVEPIPCGGGAGFRNSLSCSSGEAEELAKIAARPPAGMTLYKYGSRSVVGTIKLAGGTPVVLKYYYPKGFIKHLTYGVRGSRCLRSWSAALAFEFLELPTPPALLFTEWHSLGSAWLEKSFLATGQAAGITLEQWVRQYQEDYPRLESMAEQLRGIFERMATYRISHGDLKASNVLVAENDSVSLVDLDATEFLSSPRDWPCHRRRDASIFLENWDPHSPAAKTFATVFP